VIVGVRPKFQYDNDNQKRGRVRVSARLLSAARPVPTAAIVAADLLVACVAPIAALLLRRGHFSDFSEYSYYWIASVLCSAAFFMAFRQARGIWRFFSWRDLTPLASSVVTAVGAASLITFSFDRMQSVSRSEPLLHAGILFMGLALVRVVARHVERAKHVSGDRSAPCQRRQALVLGSSHLSELYLRIIDEMETSIDVVGVLAEKQRHVGRTVRGREVVGTVDELESVLQRLSVHGVNVCLVAIGIEERFLTSRARGLLSELEAAGAQVLDLSLFFGASTSTGPMPQAELALEPELGTWVGKRAFDVAVALTIAIALSPVIALLSLVAFLDVGSPVIFWQIRPGFRDVPTRFYKFKTMRGIGSEGVVLPDRLRVSAVGRFIRRTRLDELPQVWNILAGQMSLVGPRPLLGRDLHEDGADRIRMKPGVTGWAQINGGAGISARDKMALDIWYGYHASPLLDLQILWGTVRTLFFGDRANQQAVEAARLFRASGRSVSDSRAHSESVLLTHPARTAA
jgi:lipopolysaccharide/colanic/teichoic acid biosynthesis glycosyltransferase